MGDVYYAGTVKEFRQYFLGSDDWPRRTVATYLLNAHHEMYSGGEGYFGVALSAISQETSYFCLENAHWQIVAVDTGYSARTFPLLELLLSYGTDVVDHSHCVRIYERLLFPGLHAWPDLGSHCLHILQHLLKSTARPRKIQY